MHTLAKTQNRRFRAITHLHSPASDGPASPLFPYVEAGIRRICGPERARQVNWSECLIPFTQLESIAAGRHLDIDVLCLTDHVGLRSHELHARNLQLAKTYPRVILGVELSCTVWSEAEARYKRAPEILLYGPPHLRDDDPDAPYYGLTQADLDTLYADCVPEGAEDLEFYSTLALIEKWGYAYALPHPMDGHDLTFPELQAVISQVRAVEILNGGFPADSAPHLARWVAFHNALIDDPRQQNVLSHDARDYAERLASNGSRPLLMLGGSDAHLRDLDRVLTLFKPQGDNRHEPARQFLDLLLAADPTAAGLSIKGDGQSWMRLYGEAGRIATLNIWHNRRLFRGRTLATIGITASIIRERLKTYASRADRRMAELAAFADALPNIPIDFLEEMDNPPAWQTASQLT